MTDKQIEKVFKNGFYCIEPCPEIKELQAKLKAKEQECEELKLDLIEAKAHGDYLNNLALSETLNLVSEQLDQLKAENNELKRQHQGDKGLITSIGKQNYQLLQEYDKLKTALAEIKEIAEMQCVCGVNCQDMKIILQKISEVDDEKVLRMFNL